MHNRRHMASWGFPFLLVAVYQLFEYTALQERLGLGSIRILLVIIVMLAIALVAANTNVAVSDTQTMAWIGFLVLMVSQVPFARNNMSAFGAAKTMLPYFVVYLAMITFANSPRRIQTLVWVWVFAYGYLALNMLRSAEGFGIPNSYFGDQNDAALTLNMGFPLIYFLSLESRSLFKKLLLWSVMGMMVAALVASRSRGGFIGFLAVLAFFLFASRRRMRAALFATCVVGALLIVAPQSYLDRVHTITEYQEVNSAQDRLYSWRAAWRMFLDYPVFGIGGYNFSMAFPAYESADPLWGRSHGGQAAHSLYMTLLAEFGLVGTTIIGIMLCATFRDLRWVVWVARRYARGQNLLLETSFQDQATARMAYHVGLGLIGGLIGFLVSATFLSVLYYPQFWSLVAMAVALRRTVERSLAETAAIPGVASSTSMPRGEAVGGAG